MNEPIQPPSPAGLLREVRGMIELPRLLLHLPALARQPRGRGESVLVVPGYGAGDVSTLILQSYLRFLGYRVRGVGIRIKSTDVRESLLRVLRILLSLAHQAKQEVRIVGWSLGGYLAREAARERPDLVRQVITLGTPVVGGPKYTVIARRFRQLGIDMDAIEAEIESRNRISLTTPVTAIYSRSDSVVAWEACIDCHAEDIEHVEVGTTHLGLGFSPEVYGIIAQRLAAGSVEPRQVPSAAPDGWRADWAARGAKS